MRSPLLALLFLAAHFPGPTPWPLRSSTAVAPCFEPFPVLFPLNAQYWSDGVG